MAYLILNGERFALQIGENTLGGAGDDVVYLPVLDGLPALGVVTHWPGTEPTIRRLEPDVPITVDDEPVGGAPRPLAHGARIEIAGLRLVYGDLETSQESTAHAMSVTDEHLALHAALAHGAPTAPTGGRLVELRTGRTFGVPERGLVLGRDPECDVVLTAKDASRRHAVVKPVPHGYVVSDHSANGVFVNDARIAHPQLLAQRDVLRLADTEFRFEADAAASDPTRQPARSVGSSGASRRAAPASVDPAPLAPVPATAPGPFPELDVPGHMLLPPRPPRLLATLEVLTRGVLAGTIFRIDRLATAIGRAERSDVLLPDRSVSSAHATLILKDSTWYVVDLDSTNGTYVDGVRVVGEQSLPGACTLRAGNIKMVFRPITGPTEDTGGTRRIVGVKG